ncbi:MAG TPA: Hsp33 family molecular chaperone HslO [Clostridia bacterium]|nr:Hsp33 family molecular chaperone HslO [Clostridia bacterium]
MRQDYVVRAVAEDALIKAFVARTTRLCEEARQCHDTYPTATAALGRLLTAACIQGMNLKGNDRLTIRIQGDGPLGQLVAVSRPNGKVKGYVSQPHVHLPLRPDGKLDVGGAIGKGMMYISKDLGLREPYTGSVPLVSGEIAEDLTHYFAVSEQTPSVVALGVLVDIDNSVKGAGGILVQLMPGATEDLIVKLEENIAALPAVSRYFGEGHTPEELLGLVLKGFDYRILADQPLMFDCDCSRAKLEEILVSLGEEELRSLGEEQGGAEVRCHYCNKTYRFTRDDLVRIIREMKERD